MVRLSAINDDYYLIYVEEIEKLKAKVVDCEILIAKLTKEKSKEIATDTKCIQCDYWTKTGNFVDVYNCYTYMLSGCVTEVCSL